jgi:hypothetical protein
MPKLFMSIKTPVKIAEFQRTIMPPEAPFEGEYAKLSNHFGQNFRINRQSNDSHFVSCKQIISHSLSSILARTSLCL